MKQEGLVFEIKAEDNATQTLKSVQGEVGATTSKTRSASTEMQGASKSVGGLSTNMLALAKSAGAAFVAFQGVQFLQEAIRVGREYQVVIGDMRQAVVNMTPNLKSQEEGWQDVTAAVEAAHEMTGARIPELQQLMTDLMARTNSVAGATENWERVLGLVNLTGKSTAEVTKSVGNAYNGNIEQLVELGILTKIQAADLNKVSDASERTSKAFEIMDAKLVGYADGLPEAEVQARKLAASKERLTAAIGNFFHAIGAVAPIIEGFTAVLSGAAKQVEAFVDAWINAPKSITEAVTESQKAMKALGDSAEDEIVKLNRVTGERQIASARQWAETQKLLIEQEVAMGRLEGVQAQLMTKRVEDIAQARLASIRAERGLYDSDATSSEEGRINALLDELEILSETDAKKRAQMELDVARNQLQREHAKELEGIEDEHVKISVQARQALELEKQSLEARKKSAEATKATGSAIDANAAKLARELADVEAWYKHYIWAVQDGAKEAATEVETLIAAQEESLERAREFTRQIEASNAQYEKQRGHMQALVEMAEEEAQVRASGQAGRIGVAAAGAQGLGASVGDFAGSLDAEAAEASRAAAEAQSESERERLEMIAAQNSALADQARRYEDLLSATSGLGSSLASLAEQQWDFENATEATQAGIAALGKVGGAVAGILGRSVKEQAGIRAGFELAAAAAALGAGLFFGNPAFFASAAQHTLAAGLFGAQAVGAIGGGGGGGGGGGSMKGNFNFDTDAEREKTAQAFADKIAAQSSGGFGRIELNLGTNNVFARRSEEYGRELVEIITTALRDFSPAGVQGF